MNEDRVEGTAGAIKGGVKEGIGALARDVKTEWEGKLERAEGNIQEMYGRARDSMGDVAYAGRAQAMSFEQSLRESIASQPYLAMAVAVGIGICLGRLSARYQDDHEVRRVYRYRI